MPTEDSRGLACLSLLEENEALLAAAALISVHCFHHAIHVVELECPSDALIVEARRKRLTFQFSNAAEDTVLSSI